MKHSNSGFWIMDAEEAHVSFVTSNRILHSVQAPSFPAQVLESSHHIPCCLGCRSGLILYLLPQVREAAVLLQWRGSSGWVCMGTVYTVRLLQFPNPTYVVLVTDSPRMPLRHPAAPEYLLQWPSVSVFCWWWPNMRVLPRVCGKNVNNSSFSGHAKFSFWNW